MTEITELIFSFLGSMGFALLFNVEKRHLFTASLGGVLTWGIYLISKSLGADDLFASVFSGATAQLYAQIMARLVKTPAPVFCIPALVPLIPGGALYRTMEAVIGKNWSLALARGSTTVQFTLGLAIGLSLISGILSVLIAFSKRKKKI